MPTRGDAVNGDSKRVMVLRLDHRFGQVAQFGFRSTSSNTRWPPTQVDLLTVFSSETNELECKVYDLTQPWGVATYAQDGHGGNRALRELAKIGIGGGGGKTDHARHFVMSILRVFGPSVASSEVDTAESHYKKALMTRERGRNRN